MTREEREALSQRICNFYYDSAKKSVKTMVNYLRNQNVPQSTISYVLQKFLQCETTMDLSRSGRSLKLSRKNLNNIVKSVNNRCGLSQSKIARLPLWLRCSTHIYKILCSNLSIIIHGMTLDKSLTAKLPRMTHAYHASVSSLHGRGAEIAVRKKKKTLEIGCMWILLINAAAPNRR